MSEGRVAEYDSPANLLQNNVSLSDLLQRVDLRLTRQASLFKALVDEAGLGSE